MAQPEGGGGGGGSPHGEEELEEMSSLERIFEAEKVPTWREQMTVRSFVTSWCWSLTKILDKAGYPERPFTRQENTVIQTCVVACYGIAFSGGVGSYILGMSSKVANEQGETLLVCSLLWPSERKQVRTLFKTFVASFLWAFFQWFYTAGDDCGFVNFPTFGMNAYGKK
ncbi:hypothetical protein HPP92_007060 [Vanilla planifolia]|uniref:Uncharacterized protein n=1 Tax=Vanilla planifolia TaxID=51239 RepID=A0A835RQH1_VANPL|nr:hypothetical protein HPP92_007060 [Vanilla planifolia]